MISCFRDSSDEVGYYRRASGTTPTSSASNTAVPSFLEGLEGVNIQQFIGIVDMRRAIKIRSNKLRAGASDDRCLIFCPFTTDGFAKIDRERHNIGRHTRMTHYADV